MPDIETWFDAIAKVASGITGIKATFAGGRGGQGDVVQPMIDEELMVAPAAVLFAGDWTVLAGSWEHQTHDLQLLIWIDRDPIATSYAEAVAFRERAMAVFPPHAKAFEVHPALQSVLVTGGGGIDARRWPEGSEREYLVVPVNLEVELRRAAQYLPR
jgi:hypothetical protein